MSARVSTTASLRGGSTRGGSMRGGFSNASAMGDRTRNSERSFSELHMDHISEQSQH